MTISMDLFSKKRIFHTSACLTFTFAITTQVQADPLPEPWQSQREESIKITGRACDGDDRSLSEIFIRLDENDPIMMNNTAWLQANCEPFSDLTLDEVTTYQMKSALMGYPIAMNNYGLTLIYGYRDVEPDPSTGVALLDRAIAAGFGKSAMHLAHAYSKGEFLPRDIEKARALLAIAESENVSPDDLDNIRKLISVAEQEENARVNESPGNSKNPANQIALDAEGSKEENGRQKGNVDHDKPGANTGLADSSSIKEKIAEIIQESRAYSVAYSPDGRYVLVGSSDRRARLWDVESKTELRQFRGDKRDLSFGRAVTAVAFSPDGQRVITADPDNIIRMWNTETGREIGNFSGHDYNPNSVAFSPDGRSIISGSADGTLRLWDVETGKVIRRFLELDAPGSEQYVNAASFSPDGSRVMSGNGDGTIRIWETATGAELQRLEGDEGYTNPAAFGPDGQHVVTGGRRAVRFWDAGTGEKLREVRTYHTVTTVDFSPDGKTAVFGTDNSDRGIYIVTMEGVDREDAYQINDFPRTHVSNAVKSVRFSPDGATAVSVMETEKIQFWGPDPG